MTTPVITYDNSWDRDLVLSEQELKDLSLIDGHTVGSLCAKNERGVSLLVFPDSLGTHGDNIADSVILDIRGQSLSTGNIMGFIGCRDTKLCIRSRFDKGNDNDYFMHYMLAKVMSLNVFDLQHSTDRDSVFDFILFFFPFFLNRALAQGLYREYVTFHHNDAKVRGVIDASRHIRLNIPFTGNVAYKTREHTADNALIELVRHTIEFIRTKVFGAEILSRDKETKENVAIIIEATPRYEKRDRISIINKNLRTKIHPYYTEYEPLRNLCLQILRQEELKYGKDDDTVYGVLFDGAWLWESFLNTLLSSHGFSHPDSIAKTGGIPLFNPYGGIRYPDFLSKKAVLDAKYKPYANKQREDNGRIKGISPDDLAQVISYMHVQKLSIGGFLVPDGVSVKLRHEELRGYGGDIYLLNLPIPPDANTYEDFCAQMAVNEQAFLESIDALNEIEII